MTDDRGALHVEYERQLSALHRLERDAEAEVRLLDHRLRELNERYDRTAHCLEREYRRTHFGEPPAPTPVRSDIAMKGRT